MTLESHVTERGGYVTVRAAADAPVEQWVVRKHTYYNWGDDTQQYVFEGNGTSLEEDISIWLSEEERESPKRRAIDVAALIDGRWSDWSELQDVQILQYVEPELMAEGTIYAGQDATLTLTNAIGECRIKITLNDEYINYFTVHSEEQITIEGYRLIRPGELVATVWDDSNQEYTFTFSVEKP